MFFHALGSHTHSIIPNLNSGLVPVDPGLVTIKNNNTFYFLEAYVAYGKGFDNPEQPFDGTKCGIPFQIEDFINLMSITYNKGHFILGAEANGTSIFDLYPDIGTETGICKTIRPSVDFQPGLTDAEARDNYKIKLGDKVLSGEKNGLSVTLDVEQYDTGYVPAKGSGVFMVVNHHGDKPILNSGRIKLQVRLREWFY